MDMESLFSAALGISTPWFLKSITFDPKLKRLDLEIDFVKGSKFTVKEDDIEKQHPVYDTQEKEWRHLNFFEHECYLRARVPRVKLLDGEAFVSYKHLGVGCKMGLPCYLKH